MPFLLLIMPNIANTPNRLVVALAYDGLCLFEFGIATEIFGLDRPEMGEGWYRFAVAAVEDGPLRASGGLRVTVDGGLDLLENADVIVIPGWKSLDAPVPPALADALRAAHASGARILTLCSGAFVLAATGLLDGKHATTHWRYLERFMAAFPNVMIAPDVLYVDEGSLITAAGSAAGIDACLHLVRRDFGAKAVNMVARRLVVAPHRDGGQAQYVDRPVPSTYEGARLSPLIEAMRTRLNEQLTLASLAREAGMSERTFIRRFKATTGLAPGTWITRERVREARMLLETTAASIEDIAGLCGFADSGTLRRHFQAQLGVNPASYRSRFGARDLAA